MNLTCELFDLSKSSAGHYLSHLAFPWLILPRLGEVVKDIIGGLSEEEYYSPSEGVYIHKSAVVAPTAYIAKGCVIGKNTEVRHCAFLRGNVLVGEGCVIGNSTEVKNSVIFDSVQIPHYNYVGDSILGYRAHLGAGAVTSNVKSDKTPVTVKVRGESIATGMKKLGAMVGDGVEIGCGSVLNPGSVIMRGSSVYPLTSLRGFVPKGSIVKSQGVITKRQ